MEISEPRLCDRLSLADFLCLKEPWGCSSAQPGDTKEQFMRFIGLSNIFEYHERIFAKMEQEARIAKDALFSNPKALVPDLDLGTRGTPRLPPFSVREIREDAFAQAIVDVYETASLETQNMYALVGMKEDNWIIRWLLWHVIEEDYDQHQRSKHQCLPPTDLQSGLLASSWSGSTPFHDVPATEIFTPHLQPTMSDIHAYNARLPLDIPRPESQSSHGSSSRSSYWDPVRHL